MAFLGSVLLHGIALGFFALIVALRPPTPPAPPPDDPIELELAQDEPPDTPPPIPEDESAPTPTPTPKVQQIVESSGPDAESTPPADAALSDRTTRASSSEQDDRGQSGATQPGRRMASFQFDPRPPATGVVARAEPPETAPALPQPDRFVHRPDPTPHPYEATPPPATPAPTAGPDEFATAMATPTPTPEDPFDPSIRSTSPPLPKPADRTPTRSTPPPLTGAMQSAENGTSATHGAGGVDTLATPSGRYTRQVADMIRFVWSRAIERRTDMSYGRAVIHLTIDREGLVIQPQVVRGDTADKLFKEIALQAVVMSRLPAMPTDVVTELQGKRLPMDITFENMPLPQEATAH